MSKDLAYLNGLPLQEAMWWFILNVDTHASDRQELFEALRERVRTQPAAQPSEPVIDLNTVAMQRMEKAASESTWIPPEYSANDWQADVCQFLRDGETAFSPPAPEIGIRMEGGAIQSIWADQPLNVMVIDYDTEDAPAGEEDLYDLPQDDGRTSTCLIHEYPADVMPEENARIREARTQHVDADEDAPESPSP